MPILQARDRRIEVRWSLSGTPWAMNVMHMQAVTDIVASNQTLAQALEDNLSGTAPMTSYRALLPTSVSLQSITVNNIGGGIPGIADVSLSGTDATELVPRNVSYMVMQDTNELKIKGRTYLWGFAEAHNGVDGLPSAVEATALAYLNQWQTAVAAALGVGSSVAVYSRKAVQLIPVVGFRRASTSTSKGWQTQGRRRNGLEA